MQYVLLGRIVKVSTALEDSRRPGVEGCGSARTQAEESGGQFVNAGPGTVYGTVVTSDPGFGIVAGGVKPRPFS